MANVIEADNWSCIDCTFINSKSDIKCGMCEKAKQVLLD